MPINVASGVMHSNFEDFSITGKVDLDWERYYDTDLSNNFFPLGLGWTNRYFCQLRYKKGSYYFTDPQGKIIEFDNTNNLLKKKGTIRNLGDFSELHRSHSFFIVTQWDVDSGEVWQFQFPIKKRSIASLHAITEPTGQGIELAYNKKKQLIGIRQKLEKRTLILRYNRQNLIESIDFFHPNKQRQTLVQYYYDKKARLIGVEDAANHKDSFEYDANNRLICERTKDGAIINYSYDELGRCIHSTGIGGYDEKSLRFIDNAGWTEVTDSQGAIQRYQRNENNQILAEVNALGANSQKQYDQEGRIVTKVDPNGAKTQYEYDQWGNRRKIIDALGQETLIKYNSRHLPTKFTNTVGHIWIRFYDQNYRLIATEDPEENRYELKYDKKGNLTKIIDPLGNELRQNFNARGVLQSTTDWEGHLTVYRADNFGHLTQSTDPLGYSTRYIYNVMGNLTSVEYPDETKNDYEYDAAGNLTCFTDRNEQTTAYKYGHCGRLMERIDALGQRMNFGWSNEPDRLEAVTNAKGEVYFFEYNAVGWIIGETGFDGRELQFEYDLAGNRIVNINGLEERIEYQRDALGRLTKQILPDQTQASFSYNEAGFLQQASNSVSNIHFKRDKLGRIIEENQNGHLIKRSYDAVSNIKNLYSDLGTHLDYIFDANGLLQSFQLNNHDPITLERDARGSETRRILPGHINLHQQYDAMGRLQQQSLVSGSHIQASTAFETPLALIKRSYEYNKAHLVGIKDNYWGKTTYVYDPLERLTNVLKAKGIDENFLYDANDNLVSIEQDGKTADLYYAKGDRLESKNNIEYQYDDQGRLIKKIEKTTDEEDQIWLYEWDALDQLQQITRPDGDLWFYAYDAFGRRIEKKSSNSEKFAFVWDGDVVLHELKDDKAQVNWVFDQHSFAPICKEEQSKIYSIITDHLGTPQEMIDRYGDIVWQVDYHAWGGIRDCRKNKIDCPVRFQGQWYDEESGLHYNRFRYYNPENSRYISPDPITLLGGDNLYRYAYNPNLWIDPLGLVINTTSDRTHITYRGTKGGTTYVGYASASGNQTGEQVLKTRYSSDFAGAGFDSTPEVLYTQHGQDIKASREAKATARGLEQRYFEEAEGLDNTANKQNPVGKNNPNRDKYLESADEQLAKQRQENKTSSSCNS